MAAGRHKPLRWGAAPIQWLTGAALAMTLAAVAVDLTAIMSARTELQMAADAAALAAANAPGPAAAFHAARRCAAEYAVGDQTVTLTDQDVEYGLWDALLRRFAPTAQPGNAVRVTAWSDAGRPETPALRLLGGPLYTARASAVVMSAPRDMVFVVDLSPVAGGASRVGPALCADLGLAAAPDVLRQLPPGAAPETFRQAVAATMPGVRPALDEPANAAYWAAYFAFVSGAPDRFAPDRIIANALRGQIGPRTYAAFLLACGRDMRPDQIHYTPLSQYSPECRWREEEAAGRRFRFPPREQPLHAVRRALIAAIERLRQRNAGIADVEQRDWVSLVVFDGLLNGGPLVLQPLSSDYAAAQLMCTRLQASGRCGPSSAIEAGLAAARKQLQPQQDGGRGRPAAQKLVVLVSAGRPELYVSTSGWIEGQRRLRSDVRWYGGTRYAHDAALAQAALMRADGWNVAAAGVDPQSDFDFLDRIAGQGDRQSPQSTVRLHGVAADWEAQLVDCWSALIAHPKTRLVQ